MRVNTVISLHLIAIAVIAIQHYSFPILYIALRMNISNLGLLDFGLDLLSLLIMFVHARYAHCYRWRTIQEARDKFGEHYVDR